MKLAVMSCSLLIAPARARMEDATAAIGRSTIDRSPSPHSRSLNLRLPTSREGVPPIPHRECSPPPTNSSIGKHGNSVIPQ